jgi:dipeptidyl aminopeptidase/acylaminoacyl peptidase
LLSAAAFVVGILVAALMFNTTRGAGTLASNPTPVRFREALPPGQMLDGGAALSPNGQFIAYTATDGEGRRRLWVRSLGDSDSARPLDGTVGALSPFWSADGQSIGYFSGRHLKRIAVTGGTPRPITMLQRGLPLGASWGPGDQILFVDQGKVLLVGAGGGTPTVAADPSRTSAGDLRWPYFLSDGRHFIFVVNSDYPGRSGTYLGVLGSLEATRLFADADAPVVYADPGYLLFVRDHVLMAQGFDAAHARMTGEPKTVLGDLSDALEVSAARNGVLAVSLHTGAALATWYDRSGKELSRFGLPKHVHNIMLSHDEKQALATSYEGGSLNLWKIDLERNVTTRLVGNGGFPAWSPDGAHYAFISVGTGGAADLVVRSLMGAEQSVLLKTDSIKVVNDWSPDGRYIVFADSGQTGLWKVATTGKEQPEVIVRGARASRLSPDGRAIAYVSDETGKAEVYVEPFPVKGARQQVSAGGGGQPIWRGDGRELYYVGSDRGVMATPITFGATVMPGKPQPLFSLPDTTALAVTRDGQRFLTVTRDRREDNGAITVLTNWTSVAK